MYIAEFLHDILRDEKWILEQVGDCLKECFYNETLEREIKPRLEYAKENSIFQYEFEKDMAEFAKNTVIQRIDVSRTIECIIHRIAMEARQRNFRTYGEFFREPAFAVFARFWWLFMQVQTPRGFYGEPNYLVEPNRIRGFSSISQVLLREFLERSYREAVISLNNSAWIATIVLCGSIIEGILLDRLRKEPRAHQEFLRLFRKKRAPPIEKWRLHQLLRVSQSLGIVNRAILKHCNGIRDFRNLIHPGKYILQTQRLEPNKESASISCSVVNLLIDELVVLAKPRERTHTRASENFSA